MPSHWRDKYQETRTVSKRNNVLIKTVRHRQKHYTLIKRSIPFNGASALRRSMRTLIRLRDLKSDKLVAIYAVDFPDEGVKDPGPFVELDIYMEYMTKGSFDKIYGRIGFIPIEIVGEVAVAVAEAMTFLHDDHGIVPRCIKPSNILLSARGKIKLSDYAMSTEIMNSQPDSWIRTSYYISPERVQGHELDQIKGDVWALGITLIELALGRFPYGRIQPPEADWMPDDHRDDESHTEQAQTTGANDYIFIDQPSPTHLPYTSPSDDQCFADAQDSIIHPGEKDPPIQPGEKDPRIEPGEPIPTGPAWAKQGVTWNGEENTMSIIDLLRVIVYEAAPRLPEGCFELEAEQFVDGCLQKDPRRRMSPKDLLGHAWATVVKQRGVDVKAWASTI